MATIRKRGSGSWEIVIRRKGILAKAYYATTDTEADAVAYATRIEGQLDQGIMPVELLETASPSAEAVLDWTRLYLQQVAISASGRLSLNAMFDTLKAWLTTILLPVVYWHQHLHLTQNSQAGENYRKAGAQASYNLEAHPFSATLPDSEIQRWLTWAEWVVRQFHSSSSAVEGRNGCLAQLYHNGRGLTPQHLRALTAIHNYGLKHEDGTTAARRLFGTEYPELFS